MSWLVGAVPGLVVVLAIVLLSRGVHLLTTRPEIGLPALITETGKPKSGLQRLAERLGHAIRDALPAKAVSWLQGEVNAAGRPGGLGVDQVLAGVARWLLIVSPIILLAPLMGRWYLPPLALLVAVVLPLANLSGVARKRQEQIDRDLPDFLDVLAVTVSAGLGFRSALSIVSERFGGPLAEEIRTVLQQVSNGASLRSAFTNMRRRTKSESIDEFVTAYLQSEELGAPLVETLNQIAQDMRRASAQRMRQQAAKIEPRISLVLTLCLVPGAMVILVVGMFMAMDVGMGGILGG